MGLVLGVATGAALVEIVRSRPPAPREIRLTVTPNSIPARRAATLAEDAFPVPVTPGSLLVDGDPEDVEPPAPVTDRGGRPRTSVRSPLPPAGAGDPGSGRPISRISVTRPGSGFGDPQDRASADVRGAAASSGDRGAPTTAGAALPIQRERDPQLEAIRGFAAIDGTATAGWGAAGELGGGATARAAPSTAVADRPAGSAEGDDGRAASGGGATPGAGDPTTAADVAASEGCAEARRVAEERCAVATRAREQAQAAQEAIRDAQRAYDEHMTRAEAAAVTADPRSIRAAKERAQHAFRDARAGAADHEAVEQAARDWLNEINRINLAGREAAASLLEEREAAHGLVTTIERLTVEADAARVAAEAAEATCLASRQAVAECEDAAARRAPAPAASWPTVPSIGVTGGFGDPPDEEKELEAAFAATGVGEPAILRLLRGDRETLGRLVGELAGDDPSERRRWQRALAGLVDAIVAKAIEAAYLTFPVDHPFWGLFSDEENRDIAAALSSLGHRFDGLGGWADDRTPSIRDLSLAVGYAGLDPMRIRRWPREAETRELFRDVRVAADEYLVSAAGSLTLGELVTVLGRRADALADVWNDWGRVRPLLLTGG